MNDKEREHLLSKAAARAERILGLHIGDDTALLLAAIDVIVRDGCVKERDAAIAELEAVKKERDELRAKLEMDDEVRGMGAIRKLRVFRETVCDALSIPAVGNDDAVIKAIRGNVADLEALRRDRDWAVHEADVHARDSDAERKRAMAVLKTHREFTHRIAELAGIEPTSDEAILKAIELDVSRLRELAKQNNSWDNASYRIVRQWQDLLVEVINTLCLKDDTSLEEATKAVAEIRVRHDKMRSAHAALVHQVAVLGGLGTSSDAPDMITDRKAVDAVEVLIRNLRLEIDSDSWLRSNATKTLGLDESASRRDILDEVDKADEQRARYAADKLKLRAELDRAQELLASSRAQCDHAQAERLRAERLLAGARAELIASGGASQPVEYAKAVVERATEQPK